MMNVVKMEVVEQPLVENGEKVETLFISFFGMVGMTVAREIPVTQYYICPTCPERLATVIFE